MPTPTYTPLAETTLSADTMQVELPNIDQSYRDLVLVVSGNVLTNSEYDLQAVFNDTTTGNYCYVHMTGNGTENYSSSTTTYTSASLSAYGFTSTTPFLVTAHLMDYTATDKHKSYVSRASQAGRYVTAVVGRWPSTSAITKITLKVGADKFKAGTTIALYGIVV